MTTKKKQTMTQWEKAIRAKTREEMRAKGLLPPKKKPLNRKRFIQEARKDFSEVCPRHADFLQAIAWTMRDYQPTLEDIGVAKLLKAACQIKAFHEELQEEGRDEYTFEEIFDRLKPILDA